MDYFKVGPKNKSELSQSLRSFEREFIYPIGDDKFSIDHGDDYFSFFERLGAMHYCGFREDGIVKASGAGILRDLEPKKAWYLCDLKVHFRERGQHLPLHLFKRNFLWNFLKCPRGYWISMDSPEPKETNKVNKLFSHFKWFNFSVGPKLMIYSLNFDQIIMLGSLLEKYLGPIGYLSLGGIKDILLKNTGIKMPLIHLQFGPHAEHSNIVSREGHIHMFSCEKDSPLYNELLKTSIIPSASATIYHYGMSRFKWDFILTSDI